MKRLIILLLDALYRHRSNGTVKARLGNGLCIVIIVLLPPQITFYMLRWQQNRFVTEGLQPAAPVMGTAAGLQSHRRRFMLRKKPF